MLISASVYPFFVIVNITPRCLKEVGRGQRQPMLRRCSWVHVSPLLSGLFSGIFSGKITGAAFETHGGLFNVFDWNDANVHVVGSTIPAWL